MNNFLSYVNSVSASCCLFGVVEYHELIKDSVFIIRTVWRYTYTTCQLPCHPSAARVWFKAYVNSFYHVLSLLVSIRCHLRGPKAPKTAVSQYLRSREAGKRMACQWTLKWVWGYTVHRSTFQNIMHLKTYLNISCWKHDYIVWSFVTNIQRDWFNINMPSYYLHCGNSYTGKISLYWISAMTTEQM